MALLTAIVAGVFYAFFLYYRESRFDKPQTAKTILAFLRGFTIASIIILLFSPVLKSIREEIKPPMIVMANDVSASVDVSRNNESIFGESWKKLEEDLSGDYAVQTLEFAGTVTENKLDSAYRKSTNLSGVFTYIDDYYADQNVGAVVLSSDGIFNEGSNPLYMDAFINTPLYIIARGDTTQYKDLMISDVFYNKIAYLGDKFTLQIDLKALQAKNTQSRLTIEQVQGKNRKKLTEENIQIGQNDFFSTKTIEVEATNPGIMRLRLTLAPTGDEKNKNNNVKDIYIEILDGRQKILLYANSPHPDIAAIRQLMDQNKNYETTVAYASEAGINPNKYDLIILHNLPSDKNQIKRELSQISAKKMPVTFIVGMQTSLDLFNQAQDLLNISGNSKNTEDIQADLAPAFSSFTISEELKKAVPGFPPLLAPFGEYKISAQAYVFSYQNIKKIKTGYPHLLFGESDGSRVSIFCGEGLWKWKLADYVNTNSFVHVAELLNKTLQWTSIKEDKRKFRVNTGKSSYRENEIVQIEGQLYNDNYELINEPDATVLIKDENGKEFPYTFSKTGQSYTLNAGMFPEGQYSMAAKVTHDGRVLTATHTFTIEGLDLEHQDQVARHDILASLVEKYGGKIISEQNIDSLPTIIRKDETLKPTVYQSNVTKSAIYMKWICFLLLFLLGLEWFIRRYLGSY